MRQRVLGDPGELLVESWHKPTSFKLPLAISHLLDVKVEQTSSGLEQAGQERTTRPEMVAMLIAMAGRDDVEGLSSEERIMCYREMTTGDVLSDMETANH